MEDLLNEEPPVDVYRQAAPGATDAAGIPINGPVKVISNVSGRLALASARQVEAWKSLAIEADYEFMTTEGGILGDDTLKRSDDGRIFRVVAAHPKRYGKGNINTYYKYPCKEDTFA